MVTFVMTLPAMAYDFMADGLAYLINEDGKTVTVTYLDRRKSTNYDQLTEVVIPSTVVNPDNNKQYSVTTIGESAFYSNKTITKLTIPPSIVRMEKDAFGSSLSKCSLYISDLARWCAIVFENNVANPFYSSMPFYLNGELVSDLVIPKGVNIINNFAFSRCKSLKTLKIEADVPTISRNAFNNCSNLTSVVITGNVTKVDSSAFQSCSKLTTVTLPESVDTIGPSVFASCSSLTEFVCPPNLRHITSRAFNQCSKLQRVVLGPYIQTIGQSAFSNCKVLSEVNFPETVRAIGSNAFYNCAALEDINLSINCTDIRNNAFDKTKWLDNQPDGEVAYLGYVAYTYKGTMPEAYHLVLRDSIVGIAQYAFYNQKTLDKVTLPFTVYDLGGWSFSNCSNIKEVHCKMKEPRFTRSQYNLYGDWAVFLGVNLSGVKLYVPVGCRQAYASTVWNYFGEIIEEGAVMGDVTGDNKVDVEDVNKVINVILGIITDSEQKDICDVNNDSKVDVEDMNGIINLILGLPFFNH